MVHPTAIIHPQAQIGAGCDIGPYCVIGEHVTLGGGCRLHSHVVIDGHTKLGKRNEIFPFASIGLKTQDLKWKGGVTRVEIGDDNTLREYVTVHSATGDGEVTRVGSHNHILAYCHIAHNCMLGDHIIMSNVATLAGHVTVEDYAVIGGQVGIGDKARIEAHAVLGSGCGVLTSKIVRSGETVWGTPARPLKQHLEQLAGLARLPELRKEVAELKRRLAELEDRV